MMLILLNITKVGNMTTDGVCQCGHLLLFVIVAPPSDPNAPTPEGSTITATAGEQLTVCILLIYNLFLFIHYAHTRTAV